MTSSLELLTIGPQTYCVLLKNLEFDNADLGTIGLESFFGALNKIFPLKTVVSILTRGKKIFNIENTSIKIGVQADLTLFNPLTNYVFDEKDILSISKNSIFKNTSLKGIVYGIISNGKISLNE